jgi:ribose 5-phosphate isomerase B
MKLIIGADHAGFELKEKIKEHLRSVEIVDIGAHDANSCDYPVFAHEAAGKIVQGEADKAILVCGTGQGMAMAANRHIGIRAAVCGDTFSARASRTHNDANILCLGARVTGVGLALDIVDAWLGAEFSGGRHQERIKMIG